MSTHVYASIEGTFFFFVLLPENCRPQHESELKLNFGRVFINSWAGMARAWWFFSTFAIIEGCVFRFAL